MSEIQAHATVAQIQHQKLSVGTKITFGLGDWLNTITYGMMAAFLMFFFSDVIIMPYHNPPPRMRSKDGGKPCLCNAI